MYGVTYLIRSARIIFDCQLNFSHYSLKDFTLYASVNNKIFFNSLDLLLSSSKLFIIVVKVFFSYSYHFFVINFSFIDPKKGLYYFRDGKINLE